MPKIVYTAEERKAMEQAAEGTRMMADGRKRRDEAIKKMVALGVPVAVIAEKAAVTRQTVYRVIGSGPG